MKLLLTLFAAMLINGIVMAQDQNNQWTESDRLLMSVQKICPVMGAELGSMGQPIKVTIGEQTAFLCCKSCLGKQVQPKHWATIQNNLAKAQGTCPIMGKSVSAEMKSTVVNGQQVFVCCPPCIEKIQADPKTALQKINTNYASHVKEEAQAKSDQLHIAAQQICPVSGQKLGSMGPPVKVQVGEEHAFLCCQSCTGKQINPAHWQTVQANLAKAQGICPVMSKPVDASMKSTIVGGRKIFVCCPPCIKKINEDQPTYLTKLDALYAESVKSNTQR